MTVLTKAEIDELRKMDGSESHPVMVGRGTLHRLLDTIEAAERQWAAEIIRKEVAIAERDEALEKAGAAILDAAALRKIAEDCCNATDGGCSPGVSIEFLRGVPKEVAFIKKQRDGGRAQMAKLVKYAQHHSLCDFATDHLGRQRGPCDCGLYEAIAAARALGATGK